MLNKLKFLCLICSIMYGLSGFTQGTDCSTATPAIVGLNTASGPSAGAGAEDICASPDGPGINANWYSYTPASNASVTVESCLGGTDTRLIISTGACGAQTCVTSNDDACLMTEGGVDAYASSVTFPASAGTTYYIQWDDRWSAGGFDWTLTESLLDCPGIGLNIGDPCDAGLGTGVVSDACTCVPLTAPDCATLISPADGAIDVPIDADNGDAVSIAWMLNGYQPEDQINIYLGDAPDALVFLGAAGPGSSTVSITGMTPGLYYWAAIPANSLGEATGCDVYSFTAITTLTDVPDCPTLVSPADGAIDVVLNVDTASLAWTNALTGEPASDIGIYWGLDPAALNLLGTTDPSFESINITGVEQGQTYYWSIVPSNILGEAVGCPVYSFTVEGVLDCPMLGLNIGNFCDDLDPNTTNDVVQADCTCAGVPIPLNAVCGGATVITDGIYTANQIIGGAGASDGCFADASATDALWYAYTATCDGEITVSSAIDEDQPDTRLSVYSGSCGALVCIDQNDDVDVENFSSSLTFSGISGTTYYFEWDDRWSETEFDFEVSTGGACPTDFDSSGVTDGDDFSFFLGNYGLLCGDPCDCPTDLNKNGETDGDDFSVFLGNYGLPCPPIEE